MEVILTEGTMIQSQVNSKENDSKNTLINISQYSKMKLLLQNITIEPIIVCTILPSLMSMITTQNLNLEKSCRVNLALDAEICDALSARNDSYPDYKTHEAAVQKLTANFTVWKNIIQSSLPPILLLFLGAWSDRNQRRKPLVLSCLIGETCTCICLLICVFYFYEIPLEFVVLSESVPTVFFGGWAGMFLGAFSYVSSITTEEARTVRIGAVHTFFIVSSCIGTSLSGLVFQKLGFYGVYSLALFILHCGFVYGFFFVKEVRDLNQNRNDIIIEKKGNCIVDFFNVKQVGKTFKMIFKNDGNNRRKKMFWIIVLEMTIMGPFTGETEISYYYVRYKLGWSGVDFSICSTVMFIMKAAGSTLILTFLAKLLKVDDSILGIISAVSKICGVLFYAFASNSIIFYLGVIVELFSGISYICVRSIASKAVRPEEMGALNAVLGCADALAPVIYGPLFNKTYAATLDIFPGTCYLISAILTIPPILIFLWFYCQQKRREGESKSLKAQEEALTKNNLDNSDSMEEKNGLRIS